VSLTLDDPRVMETFDRACRLRGAQGHGLTLRDLAAAHALARELTSDEPDAGKIGDHCFALAIDPADLRLTPAQGDLGLDEARRS
jgi:hypothetical protein